MFAQVFLIFLLVVVLYFFRHGLVYESQAVSILLFRSKKAGLWLYSLFFLPGTIVHELSHWLTAEILRVPTGEINVLPDLSDEDGGQVKNLGSVMTARTDPVRATLIGLAPLIVGMFVLIILTALLTRQLESESSWYVLALIFYGILVTANSMLSSSADLRFWPVFLIVIVGLLLTTRFSGISVNPSLQSNLNGVLQSTNFALVLSLGVDLVILIILFSFRRFLETIFRKRIVRSS